MVTTKLIMHVVYSQTQLLCYCLVTGSYTYLNLSIVD